MPRCIHFSRSHFLEFLPNYAIQKYRSSTTPTFLRHHPSAAQLIQKNPSSRQYMSPDAVIPGDWDVNQDSVLELDWADEFVIHIPLIPIAHECSNDIYLLDDGFRYLFYYATASQLAEVVSPTKLEDIMEAFDHYNEQLNWIDNKYGTC